MAADTQYDQAHDKTKRTGIEPYACHSRTGFAEGYWGPDGYEIAETADGVRAVPKLKFIPHTMSTACRLFNLWDTDPRCYGCTAAKDTEYANRMKEMK